MLSHAQKTASEVTSIRRLLELNFGELAPMSDHQNNSQDNSNGIINNLLNRFGFIGRNTDSLISRIRGTVESAPESIDGHGLVNRTEIYRSKVLEELNNINAGIASPNSIQTETLEVIKDIRDNCCSAEREDEANVNMSSPIDELIQQQGELASEIRGLGDIRNSFGNLFDDEEETEPSIVRDERHNQNESLTHNSKLDRDVGIRRMTNSLNTTLLRILEKLPPLKKVNPFDRDHSGRRDGSWEDRLDRQATEGPTPPNPNVDRGNDNSNDTNNSSSKWGMIGMALTMLPKLLMSGIKKIPGLLMKGLTPIPELIKKGGRFLWEGIKILAPKIKDAVIKGAREIPALVKKAGNFIWDGAKAMPGILKKAGTVLWDGASVIGTKLKKNIIDGSKAIGAELKKVPGLFSKGLSKIPDLIKSGWGKAKDIGGAIAKKVTNITSSAWTGVKQMFSKAKSTVTTLVPKAKALIIKIKKFISTTLASIRDIDKMAKIAGVAKFAAKRLIFVGALVYASEAIAAAMSGDISGAEMKLAAATASLIPVAGLPAGMAMDIAYEKHVDKLKKESIASGDSDLPKKTVTPTVNTEVTSEVKKVDKPIINPIGKNISNVEVRTMDKNIVNPKVKKTVTPTVNTEVTSEVKKVDKPIINPIGKNISNVEVRTMDKNIVNPKVKKTDSHASISNKNVKSEKVPVMNNSSNAITIKKEEKNITKLPTDTDAQVSGILNGLPAIVAKVTRIIETDDNYKTVGIVRGENFVSFGAYQFTEKDGNISKVLKKMLTFNPSFKDTIKSILNNMDKNGHYIGSKNNFILDLKNISGTIESIKAQDVLWKEMFYMPGYKLASSKKITDKKVIAHIIDHSVNAGIGGARRMVRRLSEVSLSGIEAARLEDYKSLRGCLLAVTSHLYL